MHHPANYWKIYTLLYDPPGTSDEVRCVGCKVAAGGALFASSIGAVLLGRRSSRRGNTAAGAALFIGGAFTLLTSLLAFRMASDDRKYNSDLIKKQAEETRARRRSRQIEGTTTAALSQ